MQSSSMRLLRRLRAPAAAFGATALYMRGAEQEYHEIPEAPLPHAAPLVSDVRMRGPESHSGPS